MWKRPLGVEAGRQWGEEAALKRMFRVYRWDPEVGGTPRIDEFWIDPSRFGPMVLDALHHIRVEFDPTLAFRRSCREGICGSCSMNIEGSNALACITAVPKGTAPVSIFPLPHTPVIRDLVTDLSRFFEHYHRMRPHLVHEAAEPTELRQAPQERERLDGLYECILCACCSTACPSYWWNAEWFPGPAALLQAKRWVDDSRDSGADQRLEAAEENGGLYGCRQIQNCSKVCPKHLNPAKAIAELRLLSLGRRTGLKV